MPFASSVSSQSRGRAFPTLGATGAPVSEVTRSRYFATGPYTRTAVWATATFIAEVHAKEFGKAVTVCGLPAGVSWMTLWDVPFQPEQMHGACPFCRSRIQSQEDEVQRDPEASHAVPSRGKLAK